MTLPRSLDALTGLRAARWSRESTAGQFDAFGPEAQRDQQDRAIERYGLTDTGIAWTVAHSGRTVGDTDQFRDMLARAGRDYDVLVVGYVSRFARDLRTAVNARHDLHAAGASILFADERILTSDEDAWDSWAREAVEAESYSRKLARRIREGYQAKRRRLGEPGGRVPWGFAREGRPPTLHRVEPDASRVVEGFRCAASGMADREISRRLGVTVHQIRSTLTNPIYIGQLRDGTPAAVSPVIDLPTWERVQALRAARNRRGGRPAVNRVYALPMLRCGFCGRRLIGHTGRYRHPDPCAEFTAARPRLTYRNRLQRTPGHSYPQTRYEALIHPMLRELGEVLTGVDYAAAAEAYHAAEAPVDEVGLRRLQGERQRVLVRYADHRDLARLEADMERLDAEEERLRAAKEWTPDWPAVLRRLRKLHVMWERGTPEERRAIAEDQFVSVDAIGGRGIRVDFRDGAQAVVTVGSTPLAPTVTITRTPWAVRRVG